MKSSPTHSKQSDWTRLLANGSNRHSVETIEEAAEAIVDLLTRKRSSETTLCYMDSLLAKAEFEPGCDSTIPDILLIDLFGFAKENLPKVTSAFCAEAGNFVDALIIDLFKIACPNEIDDSKETLLELYRRHKLRNSRKKSKIVWKVPDFVLGDSYIVEIKFRFNSNQTKEQQIQNARLYAELGYTPVLLHLSPDCQKQKLFEREGWEVVSGEDALDFIQLHTGFDLRLLFQAVAQHPIIKARMRENHEKLAHHRTKKMCKTFECASHESKVHLLKQISDDPESVSEVIGRTPHVPPDMKEALRDRVDASMSARMDDIKREEMTPECISKDIMNAISKLDDQKQQEIVTEMLENMSEAGRLTLMSTMG